MKKKLAVPPVLLLFLLQSGCYISTNIKTRSHYLPADFSAPVLVVTLQDKIGLGHEQLATLEQDALEALTAKGIKSITLSEAIGDTAAGNEIEQLRSNDYRALLKIVIDFWGSRTEVLRDPVPPTVESIDTDRGSSFHRPTDIDYGETRPGPTSSYKEVMMVGSLMDLKTNRPVWSGRLNARPGVVGRSFLYHRFNRSLEHDALARRCFRKLAGALAKVWPEVSGT